VGRIARYLTRQQVGLVLTGGAAWAPTQAGVLAGLEERGVDVDLLVGTGFGGLLGAAYAIGLPVQSLERLGVAFQTPLEDLFAPHTPRRADVARGRRLRHLLRSLLGSTPLETQQVPLWVVAADADTGEEVVLHTGPLADALEAGLGLHQADRGRARRRRALLDSSVLNPVPVQLAREMGADVVVAVTAGPRPTAVAAPPRGPRALGRRGAPLQLAMQTVRLAAHRLTVLSAESTDVLIAPAAPREGGHALFEQERAAAIQAVPQIRALQAARLRRASDA
jgi:NTE family protein